MRSLYCTKLFQLMEITPCIYGSFRQRYIQKAGESDKVTLTDGWVIVEQPLIDHGTRFSGHRYLGPVE